VIAAADYDPEADLENTPDSVFCAHGGGFPVKWNRVAEYMHLPGCLEKPRDEEAPARRRCIRLDDAELEAIMTREFGPVRRPLYRAPEKREAPADTGLREIGQRCYVVDGYNVIFDWEELHALADRDLSAARERLMDTLCGWAAFTHTRVVLVFDGYKVPGNTGEKFDYRGIHVVYTRERETGDMYIERFLQQVGKNDRVRVVTSDGLIQLSAVRTGAMRMSSAEFGRQVSEAAGQIAEILKTMHQSGGSTIGQRMNKS
jgi:ribosomal protection tetracycline resistance protein